MSYQSALSGLSAASQQLDVIGNNVANANTVGFKGSTVEFADVYTGALASAAGASAGIGVRVAGLDQSFSEGNITSTSNALDMAINGQGFFQISQNGAVAYTRDGEFQLDNQGHIVNSSGGQLTGYLAGANGGILPSATPTPLVVSTAAVPPKTTTDVTAQLNLDSTSPVLSAAGFNASDSTTYSYATSVNVYDSLGNAHGLSTFFVNTGPNATGENVWQVFGSLDGTSVGNIGSITFAPSGSVDAAATTLPFAVSSPIATGATSPLAFNVDFTGTTQYGATSGITALSQNGFTSGQLANYAISNTGILTGTYTNGQTQVLGQVALANFPAPDSLQNISNNEWLQTASSGPPLVGAPLTGSLGSIQSGSLEQSNVDLTTELVNMITAQRDYQANAQTIKTEDALTQTLVSLP
jgi:flagellar hook protein FlgE